MRTLPSDAAPLCGFPRARITQSTAVMQIRVSSAAAPGRARNILLQATEAGRHVREGERPRRSKVESTRGASSYGLDASAYHVGAGCPDPRQLF